MKRLIALCVLTLLAACGQDAPTDNRPRLVEQDRLQNPIVPLEPVNQSVQTEAMIAMRKIADQVKLKANSQPDKAAFYRSLSGQLNATKLAKLGMDEATLRGSFYVAGDYSLAIVGKTLTITAAKPGQRGRVEPQSFQLP